MAKERAIYKILFQYALNDNKEINNFLKELITKEIVNPLCDKNYNSFLKQTDNYKLRYMMKTGSEFIIPKNI